MKKDYLSESENINLIKKYHSGEDVLEEMVKGNLKWIGYATKKYEYSEDLFQVASIGFIKAIQSFDITKNTQFNTYSLVVMNNEILMYLRKQIKTYSEICIDNCFYGNEHTNILTNSSIEEQLSPTWDKEIINNIVNNLEIREQRIIKMFFGFDGNEYTQEEIGNILNMGQSGISRKVKKILLKIKKEYIKKTEITTNKVKIKNI